METEKALLLEMVKVQPLVMARAPQLVTVMVMAPLSEMAKDLVQELPHHSLS
ncbi:hypothetical protein D3C72_2532510 [compost metagenome]